MEDLKVPGELAKSAYELLKKQSKSIEQAVLEAMIKYILKMDISDGILSDTKKNEEYLAGLNAILDKVLMRTAFGDSVQDYLTNFDTLRDWTIDTQQQINRLSVSKRLLNKAKKRSINNVVADMMGEGLHQVVGRELTRVLEDNIYYGGGITDIIKELTDKIQTVTINGEDKKLGLFTSHVTTIGRDGLLQYHGNVNRKIIQEYDLNALRYIGSLVKNSRPQCKRWTRYNKNGERGVILISQLEAEIEWAKKNGKGFVKTTTKDNFTRNRGGHGCRHTAIPLRF
ncbi:MAG: hypothetical protein ACPGXZ_00775 [Saprospiraceae bacterium]